MLLKKIQILPLGYSEVAYKNKKYGVTRTDFNNGRSIKLYARELGGKDIVSLNYYVTKKAASLKPCEMSKEKVSHFLNNFRLLHPWKVPVN